MISSLGHGSPVSAAFSDVVSCGDLHVAPQNAHHCTSQEFVRCDGEDRKGGGTLEDLWINGVGDVELVMVCEGVVIRHRSL
jgi:hypothetical protein